MKLIVRRRQVLGLIRQKGRKIVHFLLFFDSLQGINTQKEVLPEEIRGLQG